MDERTKLMISLGASVASNCVSCFRHYFARAETAGLSREEIQGAVDVAAQVKNGAALTVRGVVKELLGNQGQGSPTCAIGKGASCCG